MRSRAFRRSQMDRAKIRAKRFLRNAGLEPTIRQVCTFATDRKPCSCWGCGHARLWEGPTRQELKAEAV